MKVTSYNSISDLPETIARRCSYPVQVDFFLTLEWFRCVYTTALSESLTPRIYALTDGEGQPVGALFCGVKKRKKGTPKYDELLLHGV